MQRPSTFDDWQRWVEEEYLQTSGSVLLFADDDSLERRLRRNGRDAAASLAASVRSRIDLRAARPFDSLRPAVDVWRRSSRSGPPPILPVLLLSSYAAAQMHTSEKFSAQNYYDRLAEAVALASDLDPAAVRAPLAESFQHVRDWWRLLHDWIESGDGARGKSTIRSHPRLTWIGYPLSQAIVREADKAALTQFFERTLTHDGTVPEIDRLVLLLRLWAARRPELGQAFRHALGSLSSTTDEDAASLARMLGEVVADLAAAWDGVVRTNDGRQRLRLRVVLDFDQWERSWRVFGETGPSSLAAAIGDETVELMKDDESGYYFGTDVPVGEDSHLRSGWNVLAGATRLVHRGSDFVVFRADRHLGAWSSVESIIPFEAHALAVASSLAPSVQQALREAGVEFAQVPDASAVRLVPGYALFQDLTVLDVTVWETVLRRAGLADVEELSIELAGRPRLVNGLRAPAALGSRTYIDGAEPDLLIPAGIEPRPVEVTLDGVRQVFQQSSVGRELARIGIGPGSHRLVVESTELDFEVLSLEDLARALGDGYLDSADGWVALQPEWSEDAEPRPLEVPRGRDRYCWLVEGDKVLDFAEPGPPALLESLGLPGARIFTPQLPRGARWLAYRRRGRWSCEPTAEGVSAFDTELDVPSLWAGRSHSAMADAFWAAREGGYR